MTTVSPTLYVSSKKPKAKKALKDLVLTGDFDIGTNVDNYITLDTVCYSKNGKDFTSPRYHLCALDELIREKYEGKLFIKYEVKIDTLPSKCALLCEKSPVLSIRVNGQEVKACLSSPLEIAPLSYDIASVLKEGNNEIVMEIDYYQGENVHYAIYGENVTESIKNCLAYDTDIEPVYLVGDFGVYGSFEENAEHGTVLGSEFYLGKQKSKISSLVSPGYPFFSGDICLKQRINLSDTGYALCIPFPFHIVDVRVNGKDAGRMMFSSKLDISHHLIKGENEIELILSIGNRNLLGPFHTHGEHGFVGPDTFERFGSWENGKSRYYNEKYAFIEPIK